MTETKKRFDVLWELYMHTLTKYRERLDELTKTTAERDRMKAALEELVKINSDVPAFPNEIFKDRIDCAWHEARAALEGKS